MKPYELVAKLVERAGGPSKVAFAMGKRNFQPTLHKFCAGSVDSPKRATAQRIADHFQIPIDALYDPYIASQVAAERLGDASAHAVQEPPAPYAESGRLKNPITVGECIHALAEFLNELDGLQLSMARAALHDVINDARLAPDAAVQLEKLIAVVPSKRSGTGR